MVLEFVSTTMGFTLPCQPPSPLPRPPYPTDRFRLLTAEPLLPHHALAKDIEDGSVVLVSARSKTALLTEDMSHRLDQLVLAGNEHPLIAPIVGVFDAGTTWNVVYYLHAGDESLLSLAQDVATKGGYTEAELHRKAFALADALHYLHVRGIVHGNLTIHHLYVRVHIDNRSAHRGLDCWRSCSIASTSLPRLAHRVGYASPDIALQSRRHPRLRRVDLPTHDWSRTSRPSAGTADAHEAISSWTSFAIRSRLSRCQYPRKPSFSNASRVVPTETTVKMPNSGSLTKLPSGHSLTAGKGALVADEPTVAYTAFDAPSYDSVPVYQPFPYSSVPSSRRLTSHIRTTNPVVRSLQLPVHFSAFGPPAWDNKCRVFIWACAPHQFEDMIALALDEGVVETGRLSRSLRVSYGTMITVAIEPSVGLAVVGESAKTFQWVEEMEKVFFDLQLQDTDHDAAVGRLCRARVIVGTHVAILHFTIPPPSIVRRPLAGIDETHVVTYPSTYTPLAPPPLESVAIPSSELSLLEPIGAGSFGTAYRALYHGTEVVVKALQKDLLGNVSDADFLHEVRALSMLGKHPHVVEFVGACPTELSIVMEYVPNGSVERLLYNAQDDYSVYGAYPRTIFARDAAHGVLNIHQGSFLHRDIAARNCLLDAGFHVKVCDFGLSRPLDRMGHVLDQPGFGPLKWMAPESLELPHVFSPASDAYMFGVLLFEIMMGAEPFGRDMAPQEAAALVLEGHRLSIDASISCPIEHKQLMTACLRADPQMRPSLMDITRTLDEWLRANALNMNTK
ncbi:protein kinase [Achlya hypogyna]|uniref:Protein kinase n=1 Tax=Achlya hypogyna TaxID=1202772 RepID=A0A1V9YB98_ACHHY|nr:protein kinase [Achlya hypogyna]